MSNRGGAPRHMQNRNNGKVIQIPGTGVRIASQQELDAILQKKVEGLVIGTSQVIFGQLAAVHIATREDIDDEELRQIGIKCRRAAKRLAEVTYNITFHQEPAEGQSEDGKSDQPSSIVTE